MKLLIQLCVLSVLTAFVSAAAVRQYCAGTGSRCRPQRYGSRRRYGYSPPCCQATDTCEPTYDYARFRCKSNDAVTTTAVTTDIITTTTDQTTTTTSPVDDTTTTTTMPVDDTTTTTTMPVDDTTTTTTMPVDDTTTTTTTTEQTTITTDQTTTTTGQTTTTTVTNTTTTTASTCNGRGVVTRKSIKAMTNDEWNTYVAAVNLLRETDSDVTFNSEILNLYESAALAHVQDARHFDPYFLPWHRLFLWEWENLLNSVSPGVTQPYFDWSINPDLFSDSVFGADRYGSSVATDGSSDQPIPNGPFVGLSSRVQDNHLITRNFDSSRTMVTREYLDTLLQDPDFLNFTDVLEFHHGTFHVAIGGDMENFFHSPNSMFFQLHHAFIDKLYRDWQLAGNGNAFSGSLSEVMQPWGRTVQSIFDEIQDCVVYAEEPSRQAFFTPSVPADGNEEEEKEAIARRKVANPAGFKEDVTQAREAEDIAEEAARTLGFPEDFIARAKEHSEKINLRRGLDTSDANRVEELSPAQIEEEGKEEEEELGVTA